MLYENVAHGSFYIFKRNRICNEVSIKNYSLTYGASLFSGSSVKNIICEYDCCPTDVIVVVYNSIPICYLVKESGFSIAYEFFDVLENGYELQVGFAIANRYITFQQVSEGYDYNIYDESFMLLDGGVYDNPLTPYFSVVDEIIRGLQKPTFELLTGSFLYDQVAGDVPSCNSFFPVDFEDEQQKYISVMEFQKKTEEKFAPVDGFSAKDIESMVITHVKHLLSKQLGSKFGRLHIVGCALSGSRCRGLEHSGSDIDVVLEYRGDLKEYYLFNFLNGHRLKIGNIPVDINPIRREESGTLDSYLAGVETYLADKAKEV